MIIRSGIIGFRLILRDNRSHRLLVRCLCNSGPSQLVSSTFRTPKLSDGFLASVGVRTWSSSSVRWLPAAANEAAPQSDSKTAVKKTEINYKELSELIKTGSLNLYDVREPADVKETGTIASAVNIPLTELKTALMLSAEQFKAQYGMSKPSKDGQNVVFYGFSSVKGIAAVEIAHKLGFKKARHFPGGWEEWSRNQLEK